MGFQEVKDPSNPKYHDMPTPIQWPDNMTVYTTSMTHQLHCLWAVVNNYALLKTNQTISEDHHWHMIHCFSYMRQAILCSADTALEGLETTFPESLGKGGSDGCKSFGLALLHTHTPRVPLRLFFLSFLVLSAKRHEALGVCPSVPLDADHGHRGRSPRLQKPQPGSRLPRERARVRRPGDLLKLPSCDTMRSQEATSSRSNPIPSATPSADETGGWARIDGAPLIHTFHFSEHILNTPATFEVTEDLMNTSFRGSGECVVYENAWKHPVQGDFEMTLDREQTWLPPVVGNIKHQKQGHRLHLVRRAPISDSGEPRSLDKIRARIERPGFSTSSTAAKISFLLVSRDWRYVPVKRNPPVAS